MKRILCVLIVTLVQLHSLKPETKVEEPIEEHSIEVVQEEKTLQFEDIMNLVEVLNVCEGMTREDIELAILMAAKDRDPKTSWFDYMNYTIIGFAGFVVGVAVTIGGASFCYRAGKPWRWFISEAEPFSLHQRNSSVDSDVV